MLKSLFEVNTFGAVTREHIVRIIILHLHSPLNKIGTVLSPCARKSEILAFPPDVVNQKIIPLKKTLA